MEIREDIKSDGVGHRSGLHNTRRDFLKLCGIAAGSSAAGLLLPGASAAQDSLQALKNLDLQDAAGDELFWARLRRLFVLKPGVIYMNTGTEGSIPRFVLYRMQNYFREFTENPWDAITASETLSAGMALTRTAMADFVGADLSEILLTHNTTEGMSFTANGLELQEGDEVLTTLHEHSGGLVCWQILKERRNVLLPQIALPTPAAHKDEIIDAFGRAITPKTRVMSFCHINYTTGLRMPVKELCQLARDNGIISVVDGAHAIGMLDLNLHDLGCDFYATSPHKWLNAPPGTGVLYIRSGMLEHFWPTVTEVFPFATDIGVLQGRGQQCTPAFACLNDLIDFQKTTVGKDRIESRILTLSSYLKDHIKETWGEESLFSPTDAELSSGLVSFNPFSDHYDSTKIKVYSDLYKKYNIIIRPVSFFDKNTDRQQTRALRVSTQIFNNHREIDKLISALKTLMAEM